MPAALSRRHFLKIVAGTGLAAGLGAGLTRRLLEEGILARVAETRALMGTVVNLTVVAPDAAAGWVAIDATFAEMARLVAIFDHRRPESALSRLNAGGHLTGAPPELVDVITLARHYGDLTEGAFDVTVKPIFDAHRAGREITPELQTLVDCHRIEVQGRTISLARPGMAVTLDGIAKGRVVDGGVAQLRRLGYERVLVEAGGDLLAHGRRDDGGRWRVGVSHPRGEASPLATLAVSDRALATSGDYAHTFSADYSRHHILDPRQGISPAGLASVTVLAPAATDADALSTAVMVLGPEAGLNLLERLPHVEGLLVTKEMDPLRTTGFPAET